MQIYLNTYGTYLHVKDALFELRVPGEAGPTKHHFAAKKLRAIVFTVPAALSTEAVALALQHNVDLIFAESDGQPLGRVWHAKLGSTTKIRKRQLQASVGRAGVRYTGAWITRKLRNQAKFLRVLQKHRERARDLLEQRASNILELVAAVDTCLAEAETIDTVADTLRGLEGTAGRIYFQTLSELIPPEHRFAGRSFRPAQDAFNAFLNYGYGILYARVEKALMIAGLDPYVGFLHRDDYNQKSMVFDFIEPYRNYVDRVVFRLFSGKLVNNDQFSPIAGGVSLAKPGKELLIERLNDYLEVKKIRHGRRNLTRAHVLQAEAHRLAQELLGEEPTDVKIETL